MLTINQVIDRRILLQSQSLEADGWEVTILAAPNGGGRDRPGVVRLGADRPQPAARGRLALLKAYQRIRAGSGGTWLTRLKSAAWGRIVDPTVFLAKLMLPAARALPADVVVAHDLPVLPLAAEAAGHHHAKLVYDSHELYCEQEFPARVRRMWTEVEQRHIGSCDAVITVNPSIARELERRYGLARVHTVHNAERAFVGEPTDKRLFHRAFGLDPATFIVLFQGGILAGRNLETLVDAMAQVHNPAVHLVFLGDGPLQGRLARRARAAAIAERVHFHAAVPWNDLLAYTASADVGIIPYQPTCLNNLYSTPNKLFEFAAAGLPMIATDLPELRRLIVEHRLGVVTDTASPANLARIIDAFAADATKLAGFRVNVADARRRLDWDEEARILIEVYRGLNR